MGATDPVMACKQAVMLCCVLLVQPAGSGKLMPEIQDGEQQEQEQEEAGPPEPVPGELAEVSSKPAT